MKTSAVRKLLLDCFWFSRASLTTWIEGSSPTLDDIVVCGFGAWFELAMPEPCYGASKCFVVP